MSAKPRPIAQHKHKGDEPYKTDIVFSVLNGRLVGIVAEVRLECPETTITDARVLKSYRTGSGPQLSAKGGFGVSVQEARISEPLEKAAAQVRSHSRKAAVTAAAPGT